MGKCQKLCTCSDILIAMSDLFGISLEHLIKGDARFKKVILEGN